MDSENKQRDYVLPASILMAAVLISGSIIYMMGAQNSASRGSASLSGNQPSGNGDASGEAPTVTERDVILGDPNAPVAFIEYGDYQCPFCGRLFSQVEGRLRENYVKTGKLKMVYRNFAFLGPESFTTAEAAECAKDQQKFWEYHDALYAAEIADGRENNGNLNRTLFLDIATELQMNIPTFTSCFDGKKYVETVRNESAGGRAYGVDSTPTVFLNNNLIRGALPYEQFASAIDSLVDGGK